ncbi:MAG: hypothetical protein FWE24_00535 [Defluviitaleaceae bacterium]|nr:hypothetical protein [Defluviitaleaceae bacterium]
MGNHYIARLKDGSLAAVFSKESKIVIKFLKNGRWEYEQALLEGKNLNFSADFDQGGNLHIFVQDNKNDIILMVFNGTQFSKRQLLNGSSVDRYPMQVRQLKNSCLIYNIPIEGNKYKLIMQNTKESGWDEPMEIAEIFPLPGNGNSLFDLQLVNPAHGVALYNSENNVIGYKEIAPGKICEFVPISRPGEFVLDASFLTLQDGVHLLYISANLFSQKLIYRRKVSAKISEALTLWEGPRIENCLLTNINGEIHAFWNLREGLYCAKSTIGGKSFEKGQIYTQKFCKKPLKASYITAFGDEDYFIRNIFVDSLAPWDVQILPDVFPEFYPIPKAPEPVKPASPPPQHEPESSDYEERLLFALKHSEKLKEENRKLKEENSMLKKPKE